MELNDWCRAAAGGQGVKVGFLGGMFFIWNRLKSFCEILGDCWTLIFDVLLRISDGFERALLGPFDVERPRFPVDVPQKTTPMIEVFWRIVVFFWEGFVGH